MMICATIVIVLGLYLALSLLHVIPWSMSWLILVGALFTAIVGALTVVSIKVARRKSFVIPRVNLAISLILLATFIFLLILMLSKQPYHYFTFLAMVIAVLVGDTIFAFMTKSKLAFIESLFAFIVTSALLYVMLGIGKAMPWHPGWLLPALSAISAVGALITMLVHRTNKKKAPRVKKNAVKPTDVDDKYYTEW